MQQLLRLAHKSWAKKFASSYGRGVPGPAAVYVEPGRDDYSGAGKA